MKHKSQIFHSRIYKVLQSFKDMKGRTVIGVFELSDFVTAFINEGTILFTEKGKILSYGSLSLYEREKFEEFTGITEDIILTDN